MEALSNGPKDSDSDQGEVIFAEEEEYGDNEDDFAAVNADDE